MRNALKNTDGNGILDREVEREQHLEFRGFDDPVFNSTSEGTDEDGEGDYSGLGTNEKRIPGFTNEDFQCLEAEYGEDVRTRSEIWRGIRQGPPISALVNPFRVFEGGTHSTVGGYEVTRTKRIASGNEKRRRSASVIWQGVCLQKILIWREGFCGQYGVQG